MFDYSSTCTAETDMWPCLHLTAPLTTCALLPHVRCKRLIDLFYITVLHEHLRKIICMATHTRGCDALKILGYIDMFFT